MLGRLMKYEWKATWKLLVPVNLLIVVMTFFACVTVRMKVFESGNDGIIFSAIMILMAYMASMFAAMVGTAIYLIYRFYTSTYGDQGYLLHTLPVDKHHIILAKVIVSTGWLLCSSFLIYLSGLLLVAREGELVSHVLDSTKEMVELAGSEKVTFFTIVMTAITYVVSMLARVLKVMACISLGQMSSNHKLLTAFGFYFATYFVQQIINGIYYMFLGVINSRLDTWYYGSSWEFMLIFGLIYLVVFYLLTWYVMEKNLNLD